MSGDTPIVAHQIRMGQIEKPKGWNGMTSEMTFKELSDEEIIIANRIPPEEYGAEPNWWLRVSRKVARKAEAEYLKQFVEWGRESCEHDKDKVMRKFQCGYCWQALKAEEAN